MTAATINPLNAELNPICHLPALLAHHILHVRRTRVKRSCVPSCYSLHFIHTTPNYTEFLLKWYTAIHVQLSHRNYYEYNTLLSKLSYVNEHLGKDSGMTAQHPVRPTPMPPRNVRQHARVIMNQCIRTGTCIRITLSLKDTVAYLFTEEFFRSKK
jgi:hypothetical protein